MNVANKLQLQTGHGREESKKEEKVRDRREGKG